MSRTERSPAACDRGGTRNATVSENQTPSRTAVIAGMALRSTAESRAASPALTSAQFVAMRPADQLLDLAQRLLADDAERGA